MRKNLGLLVVLLVALAGAGYWNYQRNLAKEEQEKGPYASYSTEQLEALAQAYESEIKAAGGRYESEKSVRHETRDRQYADEQMKEFEKASQRGQAIRNAGGALAVKEATLRDIERELSTRGGSAQELFLRRLLTF
jgi:hypothetical protein